MNDYTALLAELENELRTLQFSEFSSETALEIGMGLVERARRERKVLTVDITRHGHQLFHFACEGTTPDNDEWVRRKSRTVNRFNKSSYHLGILLKHLGLSLEEKYFVSENEYAVHGGSFPIIVRGVGVVGTVTVSGMPQEEDHRWVVEAIRAHLSSKG